MIPTTPEISSATGAGPVRRGRGLPLAAIFAGTGLFVAIVADLHFHGQLDRWNMPIRVYFHQHASPAGVICFSAFSFLGEFKVILPYALAVGAFLLYQRRFRATGFWAMALLGCSLINEALKHYFRVPRPTRYTFYVFPLEHTGYSFPSGHTMGVAITAGTTVLLASHLGLLTRRQTGVGTAVAAGLAMVVAFSLVYMGVHTLTEALGGLAVSLAWLGVMDLLFGGFRWG